MNLSAWNDRVEAIYATGAAPSLWPNTLQEIADLLDARGALLLYQQDNDRYGAIVSPALLTMAQEYDQHWQHLDVQPERVFQATASGHRDVQADHLLFTADEVAALPISQPRSIAHLLQRPGGVSDRCQSYRVRNLSAVPKAKWVRFAKCL